MKERISRTFLLYFDFRQWPTYCNKKVSLPEIFRKYRWESTNFQLLHMHILSIKSVFISHMQNKNTILMTDPSLEFTITRTWHSNGIAWYNWACFSTIRPYTVETCLAENCSLQNCTQIEVTNQWLSILFLMQLHKWYFVEFS